MLKSFDELWEWTGGARAMAAAKNGTKQLYFTFLLFCMKSDVLSKGSAVTINPRNAISI